MTDAKHTAVGDGRPVTGRRVLAWIVAGFALVFLVNGVMAWLALSTFRGTVVDSAYRAGQAFNAEAAAARAQSERGWAVTADLDRLPDGEAQLKLSARDGAGAPLGGAAVTAVLQRPTDRKADHTVPLAEREAGVFVGRATGVEAGQWDVVIAIAGRDGVAFRSRNRVILR